MVEEDIWIENLWFKSWPKIKSQGMADWAKEHVRLVGSVRSEAFDVNISPWLIEPFQDITDPECESLTLVMPAQSGKSTLGEIAICYKIATSAAGDIQFNWENDEKGKDRFKKRVRKILEACKPVKELMPSMIANTRPVIAFPHLNFTMQGVSTSDNLESESVTFQVNEEVHAWKAGRKRLADKRLTAVWNSMQINISTGGKIGDQLHTAMESSTKQKWMEPCSHCGEYQAFHTKVSDHQLGGLHYQTIRKENTAYDYDAIAETIYYECEHCGEKMLDDYEERRQRSMLGKYEKAEGRHRGRTMQGVSVYWIPWRNIVQEKLEALAALRRGDRQPWIVYLQRVEGGFYDPRDRPHVDSLSVNLGISKSEGLEDREFRGMTVDKQRGKISMGQVPYYWAIIRDWKTSTESRLVWEGKLQIDEDIEMLRMKFDVEPRHVLVDSGDGTNAVYRMCARFGYVAIKGGNRELWPHRIGGVSINRIYSPLQRIDPFTGTEEEGRSTIPFLLYSKSGIRDRLDFIRAESGSDGWQVYEDVSEDYKAHMVAEELEEQEQKDGSIKQVWIQHADRNDLFVCEAYQALLADLVGLTSA